MNTVDQNQIEEIVEKAMFHEMISADQLRMIVDHPPPNLVLLDVRSAVEHQEGIIPGSHIFPCDHNLINREDTLPFRNCFARSFRPENFQPDTRYILICRSGPRTEIALEIFLEHGLTACELIGGVEEWKRQTYPLSPPDLAPVQP